MINDDDATVWEILHGNGDGDDEDEETASKQANNNTKCKLQIAICVYEKIAVAYSECTKEPSNSIDSMKDR